MIIDDIKKANIVAMKEKNTNARTIYSILMNKALIKTVEKREKGEELNDEDMLAIIQKTLKELDEEKLSNQTAGKSEEVENLDAQIKLIAGFLPAQMTAEEIKAEILKLDDKSLPAVMRHFKTNFNGKCDMKIVKSVVESL